MSTKDNSEVIFDEPLPNLETDVSSETNPKRERKLTDKGESYLSDRMESHTKSCIGAYNRWKDVAKLSRSRLKEVCSDTDLEEMRRHITEHRDQVAESYKMITNIGTPSPELVSKIDACWKLSEDILDIMKTRIGKQSSCNEVYVKEETRVILNKDDNHSIFGDDNTETNYTYKSTSSRTDAKAELAAKQVERERMKKIYAQQALLNRREADIKRAQADMIADIKKRELRMLEELELEKTKLQQMRDEKDVATAKARLDAYEEEEQIETRKYDWIPNPKAETFKPKVELLEESVATGNDIAAVTRALQDSLMLTRLPVPEPPVFTGDALHYMKWKLSFQSLIEGKALSSAERMFFLQKYLSGPALKAVEGFFYSMTEDSYQGAWKLLEERYGHSFNIQEAFRSRLENWPKISAHSSTSLLEFADFLRSCSEAMRHVPGLAILNDCKENQRLTSKLPDYLATRWNRKVTEILEDTRQYPLFSSFVNFVSREAQIATNPITSFGVLKNLSDGHKKEPREPKPKYRAKGTTSFATTTDNKEQACLFCKRMNHSLKDCRAFVRQTPAQRRDFIKKSGLCFGCLDNGHVSKKCSNKSTCEKCKWKHPTCLHGDYEALYPSGDTKTQTRVKTEKTESTKPEEDPNLDKATSNTVRAQPTAKTTMLVVPVYLSSRRDPGKEILVYALLDTQSDSTFVLEETVRKLDTVNETVMLKLSTMTSTTTLPSHKYKELEVRGLKSNSRIGLPSTYSRDYIPISRDHIPTSDTARKWPHLRHLKDSIPPMQDCEVALLIGVNCPKALAPVNFIGGADGEPFAVETPLGWSIVGGPMEYDYDDIGVSNRIISREVPKELVLPGTPAEAAFVHKSSIKEVTPPEVLRALEGDVAGGVGDVSDAVQSQDDVRFLQIMGSGVHRTADGFYELPLPFRDRPRLPDNRQMAEKRLECLKRKLRRDAKYYADYKGFVLDVIKHGDAEEVPEDEIQKTDQSVWYIPHHGIYHPRKPDKIRVVFDCSASYKDTCLNDHLLQGPDLLNNLTGVLCRFRREPVAVTCDIERMFHRFRVDLEDRDYLRFLWWRNGDIDGEVAVYRMKVHLFGAKSSPACANYALKKLAEDYHGDIDQGVFEFITRDFYVDDGLCSTETTEEAIKMAEQARDVLMKGNIRLHKFASNSRTVVEAIPASERSKEVKNRDLAWDLPIERTLGTEWDLESDQFQFRIVTKEKTWTRRSVLSTVASVFDPLGMLAPFVLLGKQILQQLCAENRGWDEPLSDELATKWEEWRQDLATIEDKIRIDRCFVPIDFGKVALAELHFFSDASFSGYGQCVYLRLVNSIGNVHCTLVMAKARVVPRKAVTVPRLELNSAVLSVQVAKFLRAELGLKIDTEYFWTDSMVVLGYIANETKRFHVYVANRVQKIKDATRTEQWQHVKTAENPADIASRGADTTTLIQSNWYRGPDFLWRRVLPDSEPVGAQLQDDDPEVRTTAHATRTDQPFDLSARVKHMSDWYKAKRAVALCVKFVEKLMSLVLKRRSTAEDSTMDDTRTDSSRCSVSDLQDAENRMVRAAQKDAFAEEINTLRAVNAQGEHTKGKRVCTLKKGSPLYKLDPFMDDDGILRVGGRLKASDIAFPSKHPAILPKTHHITLLIVRHCHSQVCHQGRGITTNEIRSRGFWILGCSSYVARFIHRCVTCRRLRGKPQEQKMADLPVDRVEQAPPFSYCAVDYFGPFYIKEKRSELKRYGVLFTCLGCRAIHLEIANTLDTDSYICALRRFIALRGPIRLLRSDQGTNFVGARNELQAALLEMDQVKVQNFLEKENCDFVNFKMNVPSASHMGGVWERQIRSVRNVLASLMHEAGAQLNDESLRTFMCEASAIVNSRPLTTDNLNDPTSLRPLSPNDILTMKTKVVLPPPGRFVKEDLYSRKHWRRVQYLANQFWDRWKKEYLQNLQTRQKWNSPRRDAAVGDVVIVKDECDARCQWRLGRVEEIYPDVDDHVRKVKLAVADSSLDSKGRRTRAVSYLERPVQKLILLLESEE